MDNKTDYERIITVFRNTKADFIALQEVDSVTRRSDSIDVLRLLSSKLNMHELYGAAISFQGGKYGVGIMSKKKAINHYTIPLPGKEEKRVLLIAEFKKHVIFCTHLSLTETDRNASAKIINEEAKKFNKPIYLLGDFNAEPGSETIKLLNEQWQLLSTPNPTFPADNPIKCIDYIFGRNIKKAKANSIVIEEPIASDHRPVFVEMMR